MANTTIDKEDTSVASVLHQGKTIAEWEKLLKKDFDLTQNQILKLVRSGVDLGRMLQGLDEADSIDNKTLFKDEEFFFEKKQHIVNETSDEDAALDESARQPEDVVTVGDFIELLRTRTKLDDKLMLRVHKKEAMLFDVNSRGGVTVVDIVPSAGRMNEDVELDYNGIHDDFLTVSDLERLGKQAYPHNSTGWTTDNIAGIVDGKVIDFTDVKYVRPERYPSNGTFFLLDGKANSIDAYNAAKETMMNESTVEDTPENWKEAADWFNSNGCPIEDNEDRLEQFAPQGSQFLFKTGHSPTGEDKVFNFDEVWQLYKTMAKGDKQMNEGRSWYGGGYGGTGRSYSKLNGRAPRGAEIGWYAVEQLDPKAKGKMPGWRCGPSNFPFKDLFFPNRKYKIGTMVMRNKYVNAGEFSGEVYIAIPSYFEIVKSNNAEGIAVLNGLGIPLDLTFGMDPNDDYSVTYTQKSMNEEENINDVTDYSMTLSDFINQLYQISDKWGDDLLVKVVTPEPQRKYLDPKVTVNSKGGTKVVAIN